MTVPHDSQNEPALSNAGSSETSAESETPVLPTVAKRAFQGTAWTIIGTASWRLLSMVATVSIARILGANQFGEFAIIQATIEIFSVFAALNIGSTIVKYVADYRTSDRERATRVLYLTVGLGIGMDVIASLCMFAFSGPICESYLNNAALAPAMQIGSIALFFTMFASILEAVLVAFERFRQVAIINMIRGIATPLILIPATLSGGLAGAFWGLSLLLLFVSAMSAKSVISTLQLWKIGRPRSIRSVFAEIDSLWQFTAPIFVSGLLITWSHFQARAMLFSRPDGDGELGIFTAANTWRTAVIFLPNVISRVFFPIMSSRSASEHTDSFARITQVNLQLSWAIAFPLCALSIVFAEPMALIFGENFARAGDVIPIIIISVFLFVIQFSLQHATTSAGYAWTNMLAAIGLSAVYLTTAWRFVPSHGAIALASAQSLGYLTAVLILFTPLILSRNVFDPVQLAPAAILTAAVFSMLIWLHAQPSSAWVWTTAVCTCLMSFVPCVWLFRKHSVFQRVSGAVI